MNITRDERQGVSILRLQEARLDTHLAAELKTRFLGEIAASSACVLVDLENVTYADSSGLGALLFGLRQAKDAGGTLRVFNVQARVTSLIRIAQLDQVLKAHEDEDDAFSCLEKEGLI